MRLLPSTKMRLSGFLCLTLSSLVSGLLEERIISFESAEASVPLHDASIVYSADDPVGIEIAVTNLAEDLEAITGTRPSVIKVEAGESVECAECTDNIIIATTVDSNLAKALVQSGKLDVSALDEKWESYQTSVVSDPIPGVKTALVTAGSDKRGAIFGIYTLSEQCGQSPYVFILEGPDARLKRTDFIGGRMFLRRNTRRSMPFGRILRSGLQAFDTGDCSSTTKPLG